MKGIWVMGTWARKPLQGVVAMAATVPLAVAGLPSAAGVASTPPPLSLIDDVFIAKLRAVVETDIVRLSLVDQNRRYGDLDQEDIIALDERWRSEREAPKKPMIAATLSNPLSAYLTRIQAHSIGLFTEIFVMDAKGLNVGQSNITSDYWQGDEAKWQKTVPAGVGAVFVDAAEYHDASDTWRAQVNLAIADENGRKAAGAVTFEVNLTELARRSR
ncbi:MAG: hypothetical protein AAGD34_06985 [Pseudomonadota bacterium]